MSNMNFVEAMEALKAGKRVRRRDWDRFNEEYHISKYDFDGLTEEDIDANDWYIFRRQMIEHTIKWERDELPKTGGKCLVLVYSGAIDIDIWVTEDNKWMNYENKEIIAWFDLTKVEKNLFKGE